MNDFLNINLGNLLTIISFLVGGIYFVITLKGDNRVSAQKMDALGGRMINVEAELKELAKLTIAMASANERTKAIDDRLNVQAARITSVQTQFEEWKVWVRDNIPREQRIHEGPSSDRGRQP